MEGDYYLAPESTPAPLPGVMPGLRGDMNALASMPNAGDTPVMGPNAADMKRPRREWRELVRAFAGFGLGLLIGGALVALATMLARGIA